jgi:hypothetical protein
MLLGEVECEQTLLAAVVWDKIQFPPKTSIHYLTSRPRLNGESSGSLNLDYPASTTSVAPSPPWRASALEKRETKA